MTHQPQTPSLTLQPTSHSTPKEITISVVGSVDAGKSTLVGVLTQNNLDDGNGKMRTSLFNYRHELESGRTSSIGHAFIKNDTRVVNFIDLCGHTTYLKTTMRGLASSYPDFAFVCIGSNITNITKEHIRVLLAMDLPFMFVMTKIDQTPADIIKQNIVMLKKFARDCNKRFFELTHVDQIDSICIQGRKQFIPFIKISNVTGDGLNLLRTMLEKIPPQPHTFPPVFSVQNIYKVPGFGIVVTGYTGVEIKKDDKLYIGPFGDGTYEMTRVRSIHNDYREFVEVLPAFSKGCLNIKWDSERRTDIRSGMVLSFNPVSSYKKFKAELVVFGGHHTTIKKGSSAFCNCGAIREPIKFTQIPNVLRSGDVSNVEIEFMNHCYFISPETPIFLREGSLRAYAKLISPE